MSQIVQSGPLVTDSHKNKLDSRYTADEVKAALMSIDGSKAPGP